MRQNHQRGQQREPDARPPIPIAHQPVHRHQQRGQQYDAHELGVGGSLEHLADHEIRGHEQQRAEGGSVVGDVQPEQPVTASGSDAEQHAVNDLERDQWAQAEPNFFLLYFPQNHEICE